MHDIVPDGTIRKYFYNFFLNNVQKFILLKNKLSSEFSPNELVDYNINLQVMDIKWKLKVLLSHQNIGYLEQPSVLLQMKSKSQTEIFEMNENELEAFLNKLKEIHKNII